MPLLAVPHSEGTSHTCACDECTSKFCLRVYQTCACDKKLEHDRLKCVSHMRLWRMHKHVFVGRVFRRTLVASCTSMFSFRTVSDMRLWPNTSGFPLDQYTLFTMAVSDFFELHPRNSYDSICRKTSQRMLRRRLVHDSTCRTTQTVDQCTGYTVPLLYVVGLQVGR